MGSPVEQSSKVLEHVGIFLRSLTPSQVEDLLSGRSRIVLADRKAPRETKASAVIATTDVDRLRADLSNASSREAGEEYLDDQKLSRADLLELARELDIPIRKGDNMKSIKEGIVEATIGYRLRSGAIRGDVPNGDDLET
ncbi:hypothetical protein [Kitasatospora aureofaciens]|uniref:hypothetical protein n=1 Tax=Kitasatospora aureofaciens TaxID=1894 RepID=UPI0037C695EE